MKNEDCKAKDDEMKIPLMHRDTKHLSFHPTPPGASSPCSFILSFFRFLFLSFFPSVETFVGALLELLVVGRLLDQVEDLDCELRVGQRVGLGVDSVLSLQGTQRGKRMQAVRTKEEKWDSTQGARVATGTGTRNTSVADTRPRPQTMASVHTCGGGGVWQKADSKERKKNHNN
jgi:hypothetical protein